MKRSPTTEQLARKLFLASDQVYTLEQLKKKAARNKYKRIGFKALILTSFTLYVEQDRRTRKTEAYDFIEGTKIPACLIASKEKNRIQYHLMLHHTSDLGFGRNFNVNIDSYNDLFVLLK